MQFSIANFAEAFIQLAIAVDVLGVLPIYLSLTDGVSPERRRGLLRASLATAFIIGLIFLYAGRLVFKIMAIELGDFMIAGGLILVLIGVLDLVGDEKRLRRPSTALGIVPIGIPLIVGPAVISVLLLLVDLYGSVTALLTFLLNMAIVGVCFHFAPALERRLGKNTMMAASKVMMLLLIAFGVRMIRVGVGKVFLDR